MLRFFEKMREKSEGERRTFALFVTFTMTGVIAVMWLFSIGSIFSGKIDKAAEKESVGMKPFSQISSVIKSTYGGVESSLKDLSDTFKGQTVEIVNDTSPISTSQVEIGDNSLSGHSTTTKESSL